MNNILWVDDEIELLKPHIIYLQSKGYNLTTAKSGDEALDIIENTSFNLIFLDENMPGLSGLETLNIIKGVKDLLLLDKELKYLIPIFLFLVGYIWLPQNNHRDLIPSF